eukprot:g27772.t1
MKFKAAVMNLLVNLLVGLQGNLGVGVEVVPVKQVPEYQAVILLEVNLGVVRMGKREIQQVVVDRMVGIFQAGEDFRLVEVFLAVEVARTISWCPRRSAWRWWSPWIEQRGSVALLKALPEFSVSSLAAVILLAEGGKG